MEILAADPTQRELPLSNQTRFKSTKAQGEQSLPSRGSQGRVPGSFYAPAGW